MLETWLATSGIKGTSASILMKSVPIEKSSMVGTIDALRLSRRDVYIYIRRYMRYGIRFVG